MNRNEAEKLIGTKVEAWTSTWGEYVGTLTEVLPTRPWRAVVKVEAVRAFPAQGLSAPGGSWRTRYPFPEGKLLEVGHSSVKPCTSGEIPAYQESVQTLYQQQVAWFQHYQDENPQWFAAPTLKSLEEIGIALGFLSQKEG